jgi:gamma-glutamylcyclotransferase (GGCT)/AIG2-like uncharacterized protein YtfP
MGVLPTPAATPGPPCDLLAVYGTLRRGSLFHKLPVAASRLQFFGYGLIRGRLFWQRAFPALVEDQGTAVVEIFRVVDPKVIRALDFYEGFDLANPRAALFIRRQVLLLKPQLRAWAYFLNRNIPLGSPVPNEGAGLKSYGAGRTAAGGPSQMGLGT